MAKTERIQNMTKGGPAKLIFTFAIPLMLGNVFQQFYTVVDTAIVGQALGVNALAALGAADWLNWLVLGLIQGFAQGFSIYMAQRFGAEDHEGLNRSIGATISLSAVISILTVILSQVAMAPVLRAMNTPEEIIGGAFTYLRIMFAGIPIIMAYNVLASILRALGDSKTPLYAMVIASILNIGLDLLFVMVFHWGIAGAVVATVIAQLFGSALLFARCAAREGHPPEKRVFPAQSGNSKAPFGARYAGRRTECYHRRGRHGGAVGRQPLRHAVRGGLYGNE